MRLINNYYIQMGKNYSNMILPLILMVFVLMLTNSCKKEDKENIPILVTSDVSDITETTAKCGGIITSEGNSSVSAYGICWGTGTTPTIIDYKTIDGSGLGVFTSSINGLSPNTTYYVRAYAANTSGTSYGNVVSFTTSAAILATLTTNAVNIFTSSSAVSGGNITYDGGATITDRGICWSSFTTPTINDNKTTEGIGIGTFVSNCTNLTALTRYFVRAYATNSAGTAYGNEVNLTTYALTDIDNNNYNSVTIGNQTWLRENLKTTKYSDGTPIPNISVDYEWKNQNSGAYCWYNNNINNKDSYGALYNYYTVEDSRKLCPIGWHIPTDAEWSTLVNYLGGSSIAGGKLKATTLWNSPNTGADNSSNFTAFPGGYRSSVVVSFLSMGNSGNWWTATKRNATSSYNYSLNNVWSGISRGDLGQSILEGLSVRCIKD